MKRIVLFLITNLAIMLVLSVTLSVLGVDKFLNANGLNVGMLLVFSLVVGFGGSFISLLMSKPIAKWTTGAQVVDGAVEARVDEHRDGGGAGGAVSCRLRPGAKSLAGERRSRSLARPHRRPAHRLRFQLRLRAPVHRSAGLRGGDRRARADADVQSRAVARALRTRLAVFPSRLLRQGGAPLSGGGHRPRPRS